MGCMSVPRTMLLKQCACVPQPESTSSLSEVTEISLHSADGIPPSSRTHPPTYQLELLE
jgi:hypothetical protein